MKTRRQKEKKSRRMADVNKRLTKHDSGGSTSIKPPAGLKWWKPKVGNNRIDIIPFVAKKDTEFVSAGDLYFEQTYYQHGNIGANSNRYCCPARMKNKPCPVCKYLAKIKNDPEGDPDLEAKLKVKERQLFLILDHADLSAGVQLWDFAFPCFGKLLDSRMREAEEDEEEQWKSFFDPGKKGSTLRLIVEEKKGGGYSFMNVQAIELKARNKPLDINVDKMPCLQDLPIVLKSEELSKIFHEGVEDSEGSDDSDSDDDYEDFEKGESSVIPKKGGKIKYTFKGKKHTGTVVGFDDDSIKVKSDADDSEKKFTHKIDEDDDSIELVKAKAKKAKDEDDEDEDEDDEEETPKKKGKKKAAPAKKSKKPKKAKDDEDEDDEDDDDSDDDEEESDSDDDDEEGDSDSDDDDDDNSDDDDSELDDEDEDEDDEEETPKKKGKK